MEWRVVFSGPCDLVLKEAGVAAYARRPVALNPEEGGCDLPINGCAPALLPDTVEEDFKPVAAPPFWSRTRFTEWLLSPAGDGFGAPPSLKPQCWAEPSRFLGSGYMPGFPHQERFHVEIDKDTFAAKDTMLFKTVALELPSDLRMAMRVDDSAKRYQSYLHALDQLHPLGGERRLVRWNSGAGNPWECPPKIPVALKDAKRVRLVLASPAVFENGWMPDGFNEQGEGTLAGVNLKLAGAVTPRWLPISGWSLEPLKETGRPGPKAIRRAVPAGSVYFFDVKDGDAAALASLWLQSLCTGAEAGNGFGLALFGIWNPHT